MAKKAIIFDLDGTIANCDHRRHHVQKIPKDWKSFYGGISDDVPRSGIKQLIDVLHKEFLILILTGRPDLYYPETVGWLKKHKIKHHVLMMRDDTSISDVEMKKIMLDRLKEVWSDLEIVCVFDDRQRLVDFWRSIGLECYQVDKWSEVESK